MYLTRIIIEITKHLLVIFIFRSTINIQIKQICRDIHLDLFITHSLQHDFGITLIIAGPQNSFLTFLLHSYILYIHYNLYWIANKEIGFDPNNSVIKRLWCIRAVCKYKL